MSLTMCFTGHRQVVPVNYQGPPWPGQSSIVFEHHNAFVQTLAGVLLQMNDVGYTTFISGGALGVDQLAARAVLELKRIGKPVHLIIAKPFPGQDGKWPAKSKAEFQRICSMADQVVDVSLGAYSLYKMQVRNEWMVNNSHLVFAAWDGVRKGGTWNCIQYACSKGKPPMSMNPSTFELGNVKGV